MEAGDRLSEALGIDLGLEADGLSSVPCPWTRAEPWTSYAS